MSPSAAPSAIHVQARSRRRGRARELPFRAGSPGRDPLAGMSVAAFLFIVWGVLGTAGLEAQEGRRAQVIPAVQIDVGPIIDGVLDDPVWERAAVIRDFVQQEPNEGQPASERTEVLVMYDPFNLYIGVRAFQSDPATIVATEMRRDSERILEEDNIQIILDTFLDSRSGYMFATNPLGAKLEQQVAAEGEGGRRGTSSNVNRDWDGVWDVATRRTPEGWVAEIAIPMVTLRFPPTSGQAWGINVMRNIAAKNEQAYWAPIPKGYSITRVSQAGLLTDLRGMNRGRDLRIKPFAVGGGRSVLSEGARNNAFDQDIGLDLKYGISAGLNLDVTVNTDFAQAEIDDERVNLTRFALFYPEKRDFFLENSSQFNVGTTSSMNRMADLFFSRRIGLSPTGANVPILAGARLTGKVGRNNVAVMDVQTDEAFGIPGENFLVARYSRDLLERSRLGVLAINKQATSGGHYNRTYATDFVYAPNASLTLNGFVAATATPGLEGDNLGGHLRAGWLDRSWNVYAEYTDLQDNFNAEVGFVPRTGIRISKFHVERTPRPGRFGIRVMEPMVNITYTTDQQNRLVTRQWHYMLGTRLENGAYINIWYNRYFERLDRPFTLRPGVVVQAGAYRFGDWRFSFSSNPSRRIYGSASWMPQTFFDGDRTDWDFRLGARLSSRFATEGQFTRNDVDLPAGAFAANIGSFRLDYALSPAMTVRGLTQYNSLTDQWSTSARFHYVYRPGSDIYIVYNEVQRDPSGLSEFRDRHLILKLTYLVSR